MKQFNTPLIVGYKGEIGSFILSGLLKTMPKALDILCYDTNENANEKIERIKKSDTIFLCLPINKTIKWFCEHYHLLKDKTIIEQCSLKGFLYNEHIIKENKLFNLLSMHILFKPSRTPHKSDRTVALLYKNKWKKKSKYIEQITDSNIVWFKNYEEHDKTMAVQQALVHRIVLTLGNMLEEHTQHTYIGKRILELSARIKAGDKELYNFIQSNHHIDEIHFRFKSLLTNKYYL